jgi:hypothetical protein
MELEGKKEKKLRKTRSLVHKSSYRKGKKLMKDRSVMAHDGISDDVPKLRATNVTDTKKKHIYERHRLIPYYQVS